jgi:hypothetical protein
VLTLAQGVVTPQAGAVRAVAHRAGIRAIRAAASVAFVVVHALVGAMLAVQMAVMQVVNMVAVQHRVMSTPRAMGMTVVLSLSVLHRGQDASLPRGPSHAYMRSHECQGASRSSNRVTQAVTQRESLPFSGHAAIPEEQIRANAGFRSKTLRPEAQNRGARGECGERSIPTAPELCCSIYADLVGALRASDPVTGTPLTIC